MEMKKLVGKATPEERDEIQKLFERKNGLIELAKVMPVENEILYEKMVKDLGATAERFQEWWNDKSASYGWESHPDGSWEIDFKTCEIFLVIR